MIDFPDFGEGGDGCIKLFRVPRLRRGEGGEWQLARGGQAHILVGGMSTSRLRRNIASLDAFECKTIKVRASEMQIGFIFEKKYGAEGMRVAKTTAELCYVCDVLGQLA